MSSSFFLTEVEVGFVVGEDDSESKITSFQHKKSGTELNFGIVGTWLVDAEGQYNCEFPKEQGKYIMQANWHDDNEYFDAIWDVKKIG